MEITKTLYVKTRIAWRKWLDKNHDKENDIWLIYYKKASGKPRIPYNEAVEEALCYGWIDSILKGIDRSAWHKDIHPENLKATGLLSILNA